MADNDTQAYVLDGKRYVVPKGTSLDDVQSYIESQNVDHTEAAGVANRPDKTAQIPNPGLGTIGQKQSPTDRPLRPGVSQHYATPQNRPLTPEEVADREKPNEVAADPFRRIGLGAEQIAGRAPGQTESEIQKGLHNVITGGGELAAPVLLPVAAATAPLDLAVGLGAGYLGQKAGYAGAKKLGASEDTANLTGDITGGITGYGASKIPGAIGEAAMEDPDVAALKALKRGGGKKAVSTLEDVNAARPYVKGVKDLTELQNQTAPNGPVRAEIWKPYNDALQKVGNNTVNGPDGMNTVEHYEQERLKVSARLQATKNAPISAQLTAEQKQTAIADLMERDKAIKAAIDPELQKTGIDPQLIRDTHGAVSGVNKAVEGRSTITEDKPFGLGKMKGIRPISDPWSMLGKPMEGLRDIAAGRPLWSGSPTDVNVREGFRIGGPKPNLSPFTPLPVQGNLPNPGPMPQGGPLFQNPVGTNPTNTPYPPIGPSPVKPSFTPPAAPPVGTQFNLGESTPGPLFEHTASVGEKQRPRIPVVKPPEPPIGTQENLLPSAGPLFNNPTEVPGSKPASYVTMGQKDALTKLKYTPELISKMTPEMAATIIKRKITPSQITKGLK